MNHRRRAAEWMDEPAADSATLSDSLSFIERINRRLGYTRATLWHLKRLLEGRGPRGRGGSHAIAGHSAPRLDRSPSSAPITILDIATGSADVPRAILHWADAAGFDLRVTGVDRHPVTLRVARRLSGSSDDRLTLMQADALKLPFADRSFDYVISSMFLHHLDDSDVVKVIAAADRIARRGVIIADLLRHRRALAWITLFTMFSNPMVKHDARVSVRQAFTKDEILRLRDAAGASYLRYVRHFAHRFVLWGAKPLT